MKEFFAKILAAYDYNSFEEFFLSLFPSFKYQLHGFMIVVSAISGVINYFFGIGPALAIAMFVVVIIEIRTGLKASKKMGRKFESFRFSRCWIKVSIWLVIIYVIHAFELEFSGRTNILQQAAGVFFNFVYVAVITSFLIENVTSILENIAVINGQPKTKLIDALKMGWDRLIEIINKKQV